jgi:hypothetical protein
MRLLFALLSAFTLNSCIYTRTTSQVFEATGDAPEVGGAAFRAEFIPRGSEAGMTVSAMVLGGAAITENGPYQLRLHAFGQKSDQTSFRVTRFVLTVPGRLNAPMESKAFHGSVPFESLPNDAQNTRASLLFSTRIFINTAEKRDKEVIIEADVEVTRRSGRVRGTLRIPMKRTKSSRDESIFIPQEIARSFRGQTLADIPSALPPAPERP